MTVSSSVLPLDAFDHTVRVQDDLYRHVNGRWLAETPIPDDKPLTGAFMRLRDEAEEAVRDIITGMTDAVPGTDEARIADLYASFMDEDAVERAGAAPLAEPLRTIDSLASVDDLIDYFGHSVRQGTGSLLGLGVDADPGNPNDYILFIGQSGLGLPDEEYYRLDQYADIRTAYQAHIARSLQLAGVPEADDQARLVLELETAIASHHWDKVRTRDMRAMYNPTRLDEAEQRFPGLTRLLAAAGIATADDLVLVDSQPSFLDDVTTLFSQDRLPAWRAWARWHAVSSASPYLSSAFVEERFGFYGTTLWGTPQLKDRWKRGVDLVEGSLGEAVGKVYVERYFSAVAKERMDELVANLIEAYRRSISTLDWMTDATRAEALAKLASFTPKIGYPEKWRDYSALEIVPGDLIGNLMRSTAFELDYEWAKIGNPVLAHEWFMTPQTVNAYYHPLRNEIVFPAAILQPPFFHADADDAVNYGGIGAVIGHEIGHGFDDQGSTCDGEGRLRDWWTDADRTAFEERTKALIGQYDELSPAETPDLHVNGELTIGENIGDLGGLAIAYLAWQIATGGEVAEIDGYTGAQRLFLSWGAVWQQKSRTETVRQRLAVDPHSPPEFRCNQIVKNLAEFQAAFDVRPGDELWLDPADRVRIW